MRRWDAFDPDEGGRYDGDDQESHSDRFNRPEWLAIVAEQEAAKSATWDEYNRRLNAFYRPKQPGQRDCTTCSGAGVLRDTYSYGPESLVICWRCNGARYLT